MELLETVLKIFIEAILVSGILGYFFLKREERLKRTIEAEFKKRDTFFNAQFDYKRRALEELLGPMMMQLNRSFNTLTAYKGNDAYKEAILKQCNETVRDLLLNKGFLIPADLQNEAGAFLKHYDEWLQHYHQLREVDNNMEEPFVFTYDFPGKAEEMFRNKYDEYRKELRIDKGLA